jgi:hypothetical protein
MVTVPARREAVRLMIQAKGLSEGRSLALLSVRGPVERTHGFQRLISDQWVLRSDR